MFDFRINKEAIKEEFGELVFRDTKPYLELSDAFEKIANGAAKNLDAQFEYFVQSSPHFSEIRNRITDNKQLTISKVLALRVLIELIMEKIASEYLEDMTGGEEEMSVMLHFIANCILGKSDIEVGNVEEQ